MKKWVAFLLLVAVQGAVAQNHSLTQIWSTDAIVNTPESVYPDLKNGYLYTSLIEGAPWEADGKGGIGRLKLNGTAYDSTWITGLNAPKGLGVYKGLMYAADLSDVVVIDMARKKIVRKIPVEGASELNDITVTDKGIVYVSDSKTGKIWKIEKEKPVLYLDNVTGANGLKTIKDDLYYAKGPMLMKADSKKQITQIADVGQGIDGIESLGNGDFIVTSWPGYIFYVYAKGNFELLLDTHDKKINSADIGYNPEKKIVYVPTFFDRRIVAYQLK
jgi:hypothetical protein